MYIGSICKLFDFVLEEYIYNFIKKLTDFFLEKKNYSIYIVIRLYGQVLDIKYKKKYVGDKIHYLIFSLSLGIELMLIYTFMEEIKI